MIFKTPRLALSFDNEDIDDRRYLSCNITNSPIASKWWRRIISRNVAVATANFTINDSRTHKLVSQVPNAQIRIEPNSMQYASRVSILPSNLSYAVPLVVIHPKDGAVVFNGIFYSHSSVQLNPGKYEAIVHLVYDGGEIVQSHLFTIGSQPYEAYWG
jgi:hypothetical protein